jgi:hypothetical protein
MGGGGPSYMEGEIHYQKARELGLKHANIKFIESAKRDTHIESDFITYQLAGEPFSKTFFVPVMLLMAGKPGISAAYRAMFESLKNGKNHTDKRLQQNPDLFDDDIVQNYLGRNFVELVIEGYEKLLGKEWNIIATHSQIKNYLY